MSPFFLLCIFRCRYGATLIVKGEINFVQMMTAMLALMLGALGLGQALNDLGIIYHIVLNRCRIICLVFNRNFSNFHDGSESVLRHFTPNLHSDDITTYDI